MDVHIRSAEVDDIPLILDFIQQKAVFDRCPDSVEATAEKLEHTLFGDLPLAIVAFAEVEAVAVGFASFFHTYSTFLARPGIWLDDLYVQPHMRGQGIGAALIEYIGTIAQAKNCGRIEWTVAIDNASGIGFYQHQGAAIREEVRLCRLDQNAIKRLVERKD